MDLIPKSFYLDDVFENFLNSRDEKSLKCDVYEKDGLYHIEMDAPGFKKEDVEVELEDGYLTIKASKKASKDEENKNYIRRERYSNEYKRQFYIGNVDIETIKAKFDNGSLKVEMPIIKKEPKKKIIEIE